MTSLTRIARTRRAIGSAGATARSSGGATPRSSPTVVLARYRLHRPLGSGGFGTVWLARDERLERDVAVKVLPRERIVGGRFEREARAAARLSHPGIVTLYEAAVDDDGAYLVSELVRGATLGELLDAGRLSDRDIVELGIALCDALAHAHGQGVVHRDVKPSNVLVPGQPATPAQVAKLTDFGVARVIGGDSLTRTGDVIGTAAYMAPEQAEGREAGAPADLYSLSLVIYEALTGVNPIATGSAAQRARRLGAHLPPLRRQRREIPRELAQAVDLALRPRPRERGTIEEFRAGLLSSLGQVDDRPGVVESPWPKRAGRRRDYGDEEAFAQPPPLRYHTAVAPEQPSPRWPERALAGLGAGLIAAWLAADVASPAPIAPVAAALLAGLAAAALPRLGWLALTLGAAGTLSAQGRAGAALVVGLAALVPPALVFRRPFSWPVAAAAPALGAVGLAGAWPALAARLPGPWRRAALGAVGWVWVVVVGELDGHGLYSGLIAGTPARSLWIPSLHVAAKHVLEPMLSSGALAPAAIWALAAVVLPPITAIRALPARIVLITVWAAGLASATATALAHAGLAVRPGAAFLGALCSAILALLPSRLRRWRPDPGPADTHAGLA
jgi:eukaryotic-like serine/threonine-protein kinase